MKWFILFLCVTNLAATAYFVGYLGMPYKKMWMIMDATFIALTAYTWFMDRKYDA